jgi:hypothetical protein
MKKSLIYLILIFIVFAFFRFYNLDKRIIFNWDQEQFSYQIKNIIQDKDFTLIGPRTTHDKGFFLGPYFTYLMIPFYLMTNLHPNALLIFVVFYNLLFFYISYFLLKKVFNRKVVLIFLFLWTINYQLIYFDTLPWWPILIPLGITLSIYYLHEIYKNPATENYIFLGLTLGIFSNMHFQFAFIILFSIFMLIQYQKKIYFSLKKILAFSGSFLLVFTPLFIFDLRNNFINMKLFSNFFFLSDKGLGRDINVWKIVFINVIQPIIFFKNELLMFFFIILIVILLIYLINKNKNFKKIFYKSFLLLWIFTPFAFMLYGKRPSEYYYVYLYPFLLIAISDFLLTVKNRVYMTLVFVILVSVFITDLMFYNKDNKILQEDYLSLYAKDNTAKKIVEKVDLSKKFNISIDAPPGLNNGFKYFLDWYGIRQTGDWKQDYLIEIRNPLHPKDIVVNNAIGLKVPKEVLK